MVLKFSARIAVKSLSKLSASGIESINAELKR